MEDPSEDSEQGSTCGEETLSEDNSQDTSSAPIEIETTKGSLDERATTVGERQYEHTSLPTPSPVRSSHSSFSCLFFSLPYFIFFFQVSPRSAFQIEMEMDFSMDLFFLD